MSYNTFTEEGVGQPTALNVMGVPAMGCLFLVLVVSLAVAGGYVGHSLGGGRLTVGGVVFGAWFGATQSALLVPHAFCEWLYEGKMKEVRGVKIAAFWSLVLLFALFVTFTPSALRGPHMGYVSPLIPGALFVITLASMIRAYSK